MPDTLSHSYEKQLRSLESSGRLNEDSAWEIASGASLAYVERFFKDRDSHDDALGALCALAAHPDPAVSKTGETGLFRLLAERLSDSFDPDACALYDMAFVKIIQFARGRLRGKEIDRALDRFGLFGEKELIQRKKDMSGLNRPFEEKELKAVKKCLILSRVSLGAEIAVTSVAIGKILEACPNAEAVLIGDGAMSGVFHDVARFRVRHCPYPSGGSLFDRLGIWTAALEIVDDEIRGLDSPEFIVLDPDSRFSQLGHLPMAEDPGRCLFFQSRSFQALGADTVSALTSRWMRDVFGGGDALPFIRPPKGAVDFARAVRKKARGRILATVAFGVGGNDDKRLGKEFEAGLIRRMAREKNVTVLYFKGAGKEEQTRSARILDRLSGSFSVAELEGDDPGPAVTGDAPDIIAWQGPLPVYCALIAESDVHVGYDSSNQHIAAACRVPLIDVFADDTPPVFIQRWTPLGQAPVKTVMAFDKSPEGVQKTLEEVMGLFSSLAASCPKPHDTTS
ncbi:conserved hypothetical protein [Candidatus Desulfarcum epimagneticum]|uniref:Lipopolysaccharide heptosyltransferase family protein n=1 Tax=uncultured Desulfobacteraceae bacterium TaxID=218296 RepID=A0A484HMQ6_9BACT|nr:conserved hypothetical protein [uncultured Desulfobacteraceae bacterium]